VSTSISLITPKLTAFSDGALRKSRLADSGTVVAMRLESSSGEAASIACQQTARKSGQLCHTAPIVEGLLHISLVAAITLNHLLIGQALATLIYGAIVGTVLVTGIAASTFAFNMADRGWDHWHKLRGRK
jgi:hypothetical protein